MSSFKRSAMVALVALGVLAAPAQPVSAAPVPPGVATGGGPMATALERMGPPPGGFASWRELMAEQHRLDQTALPLIALGRRSDVDGYAAITADPTERRVKLYWHGAVPEAVRSVLAHSAVPVTVLAAPYTERQLLDAEQRLATDKAAHAAGLVSVGPLPDASGLKVEVAGVGAANAALSTALRASTRDGLAVATQVVQGAAPVPAASRWNDTSPFWGSAGYSADGNCSTGFAVSQSGVRKLLTAAHCTFNGTTAKTLTSGATIGTAEQRITGKDLALINPPAGKSTAGVVYSTAYTPGQLPTSVPRDDSTRVVGKASPVVGHFVATDGAFSGFMGAVKITAPPATKVVSSPLDGTITISGEIEATQQAGNSAGGEGDSGSPVFEYDFTNNRATAVGILSLRSGSGATCFGVPASSDRHCSSTVFFVSVDSALSAYGAALLTS